MIGKGAQYLTAAGFGRYRITAASLGSLDLLGTFSWLKAATQQAIMAAFGVDGPAVIRATNEYLNGIAASDKAKATALAAYINEDPMMVCSLGLEPQGVTMPWRYIATDGNSHFDLGVTVTADSVVTYKGYVLCEYASGALFMAGTTSNNYMYGMYNGSAATYVNYGTYISLGAFLTSGDMVVHFDKNKMYINGSLVATGTSQSLSGINTLGLFANHIGSNNFTRIQKQGNMCSEIEVDGIKFVPFQDGDTAKLLNLTASVAQGTKVFATKYGSFTIPDISYTPTP